MQDDEEKMQKRLESCSSSTSAMTGEIEYGSASGSASSFFFFSYRTLLNLDITKAVLTGFIFVSLGFAGISYNSPMEDAETSSSQNTSVRQRGSRSVFPLGLLFIFSLSSSAMK